MLVFVRRGCVCAVMVMVWRFRSGLCFCPLAVGRKLDSALVGPLGACCKLRSGNMGIARIALFCKSDSCPPLSLKDGVYYFIIYQSQVTS